MMSRGHTRHVLSCTHVSDSTKTASQNSNYFIAQTAGDEQDADEETPVCSVRRYLQHCRREDGSKLGCRCPSQPVLLLCKSPAWPGCNACLCKSPRAFELVRTLLLSFSLGANKNAVRACAAHLLPCVCCTGTITVSLQSAHRRAHRDGTLPTSAESQGTGFPTRPPPHHGLVAPSGPSVAAGLETRAHRRHCRAQSVEK